MFQYSTRSRFVGLILVLLLFGLLITSACSRLGETETGPPNFIILFADDLGYGDLGVYGHPTIHTPNLDRMASEGMRFTQFYSAAPICTPSRAGLLTGRLPIRSGMCGGRGVLFPDSDGGLPTDEITIARVLKTRNYATACIGKWHLGHLEPYLPTSHGFDYYFGIPYSNDMSPVGRKPGSRASRYPPLPLMENNQTIEEEPDQKQLTRRYTEKAIAFIEENRGRPFFLYLPYTFPHVPLYASERFEGTSLRGLYGDVVEEIDWSVGEILSALRRLELERKTLVFFTSDNGPWLVKKDHGGSAGLLYEGKHTTWEGGVREPGIAWWPGTVRAGSVSRAQAGTLDLFPTLVTLAGGEIPSDRILDGADLTPLLTERAESVRDVTFYYRRDELFAVRNGPWKAHFKTVDRPYRDAVLKKHDPPLLFNLDIDPSEKYNVAANHPEILEAIARIVAEHRANLDPKPCQLIKTLE